MSATTSIAIAYQYLGDDASKAICGSWSGWYMYPHNTNGFIFVKYADAFQESAETAASGVVVLSSEEDLPGANGKVYLDGVNIATPGGDPTAFVGEPCYIGAMYRPTYPAYRHSNVVVARWSLYDIPLSVAQVVALSAAMAVV